MIFAWDQCPASVEEEEEVNHHVVEMKTVKHVIGNFDGQRTGTHAHIHKHIFIIALNCEEGQTHVFHLEELQGN